jgi:hypothetical protein
MDVDTSEEAAQQAAMDLVAKLGMRRALVKLYRALVMTAEEVVQTGNKGAVSMVLTITRPKGSDAAILIEEKIKRGPPSEDPFGAVFYAIGDGLLHDEDPRQTRLELHVVEGKSELRVPADPGQTLKEVK